MAEVLRFSVKDQEVRKLFKRLGKLPGDLDNTLSQLTHNMASAVKMNAVRKKLRFSGQLINSIKSKKVKKGTYVLTIRDYGLVLDADWIGSSKSHYIALKPGRKITRWVKSKGGRGNLRPRASAVGTSKGNTATGITVHSHPFIRIPMERELSKMSQKINSTVKRGTR